MPRARLLLFALATLLLLAPRAFAEIPPIPRVLPPVGLEIPADVRTRLEGQLAATKKRLETQREHRLAPDVEIFTKAVEYALLHREFYVPKDFDKAHWALDEANKRLDALDKGESPWATATGLVVRGYRSAIDKSVQPYGLVIPAGHDLSKPCPLYVWLHGRGDKATDLHFLNERATKAGQIAPPGAIVLHAFGRQCVGYQNAGEMDVFEAVYHAKENYQIDPDRMVLIGFSMGGAGAWHVGAHSASEWVAVSPGAGFAETARYQKLTPDKYPPWYEQKLWGQNDTPGYVRNLFNTTVIAYSGELDKQIQAAQVMVEAYKSEGRELTHLIGPSVEHKYEPKTLEELLQRLKTAATRGREKTPPKVHLQTRTLQYPSQAWVSLAGLEQHWEDARVDAEITGDKRIRATTKNVTALTFSPWMSMAGATIKVDGQVVTLKNAEGSLVREASKWREGTFVPEERRKTNDVCGPIDDAFRRPFVVVTPTGKSRSGKFQEWADFELEHFRQRWRSLMRADLPEISDVEFLEPLMRLKFRSHNLVFWGDADSNHAVRMLAKDLPVQFAGGSWTLGGQTYPGDRFVPAMIFPLANNDGKYDRYIVLNSGVTFREGHDRTNSLQNPKLPDWAIIDLSQPPDAFAPGKIHDAGFFDEQWQLKNPPKGLDK